MFQQNHNVHGHFPFNHSGPSKKIAAFEVTLKEKKHLAEDTMAFVFEKPNGLILYPSLKGATFSDQELSLKLSLHKANP